MNSKNYRISNSLNDHPNISILFLIDQFWSERGGSEQHLLWLLKHLPTEYFTKKFIIFSDARTTDFNDFSVTPVILGRMHGKGWRHFKSRFSSLVNFINKNKIDIVHAFTPFDEIIAVAACRLGKRCKVCAHRRNIGYSLNLYKKLMSRIIQIFKVSYIANSENAKLVAVKMEGINVDRVSIIHNPVNLERANQGAKKKITKSQLGVPDDSPIIGMVATVRPIKGYEVFIRAAKNVLKIHPNAYFLSIGEQQPIYLNNMKKLARDLGIADQFIWHGGLDNPFKILNLFTVSVLSSFSESFSNAVLEYAVAERPIIASDVGGMREIINDGKTGFLVPSNRPDILADRIVTLLEDPEKRFNFGIEAKNFVMTHFSEEIILKQYIDFYRNIYYSQH
jgi:glycosyltransferase involved in cell wall biosynthesis